MSTPPSAAPMSRPSLLPWLALLIIGCTWGSTQILSKFIVTAGHHPVAISLTGTAVGALMVTAVMMALGRRLPLGRRFLVFYGVCGLLGTAFPNTISYTGMRELPVGIMSIVLSLVPMLTFLFALILRMDRLEPLRILGLACGTGAILLLVVPEASLPRPDQAIWVILPILTAASYSAENVYLARAQPPECDALQTLCGLSWAGVLLLLPATLATGEVMALWPLGPVEGALILMTALHMVSYGGFVWLISRAGPVFAAQVAYVVTLSGVLWGMALLGETHSAWVWAALALMIGGLALVQPRR